MTALADIQAQISRLEEEAKKLHADAAAARRELVDSLIREVRAKIVEYSLTARDLGLHMSRRKAKPSRHAKLARSASSGLVCRGPHGEIWTSNKRGRKPGWLIQALATGKTIEELAS